MCERGRCERAPAAALLAVTRALAEEAARLAGAPVVHDLAAAAPQLLQDALSGALDLGPHPTLDLSTAPGASAGRSLAAEASQAPGARRGTASGGAGAEAAEGPGRAGRGAPGGGRPRARGPTPEQAAAESRRLLVGHTPLRSLQLCPNGASTCVFDALCQQTSRACSCNDMLPL